MQEDFKTHLENISFEKSLKKLKKKLKNKTSIVYGAGSFFKYINENYDLSELNIVGISDMKFDEKDEKQEFLGYKKIPKNKIVSYKPDYVLIATLKYISIIEDFEINILNKTNIKVLPLAKLPLIELIKEIWCK